ncbi:hypothetical protein [Bermanella sp. R86510]|uniref:hypothetical protein n=1 Tax=unclassified Bermanella TaxID=2627862 RepID=UPI0037C6A615
MNKMKWISLLVLCSVCQHAFTWNFDEHTAAGREAYRHACAFMEGVIEETHTHALETWLCKPDFELSLSADAYGRMSALSGDHLESPEEFLTFEGEVAAGSAINYADLASKNASHFWPTVKKVWMKHHLNAIKYAHKISSIVSIDHKNNLSTKEIIELEVMVKQMLSFSAFSSHFLQDAFSIGHSGFGRGATSAELSVGFHDHYNENGAILANKQYGAWVAYGDGQYFTEKNSRNREILVQENTKALINLFSIFLGLEADNSIFFPTHTSNRFQQPVIRLQDNIVTCQGLRTLDNELIKYQKSNISGNSENIESKYERGFWSLDPTPESCLMPIDVNGAMPVRRVGSFDISLNSTVNQNTNEVFGGWEAELSSDSLFDWKYTGLGMSIGYKQVNQKGNLSSLNFIATLPYSYGDLGTWKVSGGYAQHDLDDSKVREGLLLGLDYLMPFRAVKNTSFFVGLEYYCTEQSRLRCNSDHSELTAKFGISFALKTVGGGYNKDDLFD